jgi:transposase
VSSKSNCSKRYTAEFKRDAVELALASDKTVTELARDLGVFKPERVISTSQSASVGVVSGAATGSSRQRGAIAARPSMTAVQA